MRHLYQSQNYVYYTHHCKNQPDRGLPLSSSQMPCSMYFSPNVTNSQSVLISFTYRTDPSKPPSQSWPQSHAGQALQSLPIPFSPPPPTPDLLTRSYDCYQIPSRIRCPSHEDLRLSSKLIHTSTRRPTITRSVRQCAAAESRR